MGNVYGVTREKLFPVNSLFTRDRVCASSGDMLIYSADRSCAVINFTARKCVEIDGRNNGEIVSCLLIRC